MWGLISAGLALASLAVGPKAKEEALKKAVDKALAERDAAEAQKKHDSEEEED